MKLVHGGDIVSYRRKYPGKAFLDFSANINPLGLPEGVRRVLADSMERYTQYPDPLCRELTEAIAEFERLPNQWILCGNGASDLIWRIVWALRPKRALLPAPTFADYERALAKSGCEVDHHLLQERDSFAVTESILERIPRHDMLFLCSPNNPTGHRIPPELTKEILHRCKKNGTTAIIDECFLGFAEDGDDFSAKNYLREYDNLIILKAFTKIFAMPGLRLGYALCGNIGLLNMLSEMAPTWSVSVPAQLAGIAAVQETDYLRRTRALLPCWREGLVEGLRSLGCHVYPSCANYVFFRSRRGLVEDLERRGILLRDCSNYAGLSEGYYRSAVRTDEENQILVQNMGELLHGV